MTQQKIYKPISVVCRDCGKHFVVSVKEQKYYEALNFKLPKRCNDCRQIRKKTKVNVRQKALDKKELEMITKKLSFPQIAINYTDSL